MPSPSTDASIRSRYLEQAASDLQENRRRQEELAEKISTLKQEEALLLDILNLAERFDAPSAGPAPEAAPLPQQAQDEPTLVPAATATAAATAAPAAPQRRARAARAVVGPKPGKKKAGRVSAQAKSRQPLLGDVFLDLLGAHDEPRLAKELRDELVREHPERTPTPQVVRNTLEALVAKGRIQRHKQQRSVLYSLTEPTSSKPAGTESNTAEGDA
ncbi:hypothetical protein ACQEV4_20430 [Streptomyces shenzhenensis]|uniref:hypothetical protein n=1 Tax=Streptomyces shenzhenensis TaxID=943815 RepID=UPI003D91AE07